MRAGSGRVSNRPDIRGVSQNVRVFNVKKCQDDLSFYINNFYFYTLGGGLIHSLCFIEDCSLQDKIGNFHGARQSGSCSKREGLIFTKKREEFVELASVPLGGEISIAIWYTIPEK